MLFHWSWEGCVWQRLGGGTLMGHSFWRSGSFSFSKSVLCMGGVSKRCHLKTRKKFENWAPKFNQSKAHCHQQDTPTTAYCLRDVPALTIRVRYEHTTVELRSCLPRKIVHRTARRAQLFIPENVRAAYQTGLALIHEWYLFIFFFPTKLAQTGRTSTPVQNQGPRPGDFKTLRGLFERPVNAGTWRNEGFLFLFLF